MIVMQNYSAYTVIPYKFNAEKNTWERVHDKIRTFISRHAADTYVKKNKFAMCRLSYTESTDPIDRRICKSPGCDDLSKYFSSFADLTDHGVQ